jgi:hypothetical protein
MKKYVVMSTDYDWPEGADAGDPLSDVRFTGPFNFRSAKTFVADHNANIFGEDRTYTIFKLDEPKWHGYVSRKPRRRKNANTPWRPRDDRYLKQHWHTCSYQTLASRLCRTVASVRTRSFQLGLTR